MLQAVIALLVFVVLIHDISTHTTDVKQLGGLAAETFDVVHFAKGISLVISRLCQPHPIWCWDLFSAECEHFSPWRPRNQQNADYMVL
ncbi:hypothetical protein BJ742DRAFT_793659 [Cladochytrium replicatum]|nr:hypothetical protein BJ742DRAFT_793659 [Cladochytrium replicatum]